MPTKKEKLIPGLGGGGGDILSNEPRISHHTREEDINKDYEAISISLWNQLRMFSRQNGKNQHEGNNKDNI